MADVTGVVWYLYQARRVATQANGAGGAIKIDISPAAGQVMKVINCYAANSGTNTLESYVLDEDFGIFAVLGAMGSAAALKMRLPGLGSAASTSSNLTNTNSGNIIIPAGGFLTVQQTGAGVQNDTLEVGLIALLSTGTEPTWAKNRSTNQADVSLAANTISAANAGPNAVFLPA